MHLRPLPNQPDQAAVLAAVQATMVIRNAAAKESRKAWSAAMGSILPAGKASLEKRQGRTLVVIPTARPARRRRDQGRRSRLVGRGE